MTTPNSFADAYQILKNNADRLEHSEEVDIDNLISIVDESIQAYKYCQARIDAVELALSQALNPQATQQPEAPTDADDKNLPF